MVTQNFGTLYRNSLKPRRCINTIFLNYQIRINFKESGTFTHLHHHNLSNPRTSLFQVEVLFYVILFSVVTLQDEGSIS